MPAPAATTPARRDTASRRRPPPARRTAAGEGAEAAHTAAAVSARTWAPKRPVGPGEDAGWPPRSPAPRQDHDAVGAPGAGPAGEPRGPRCARGTGARSPPPPAPPPRGRGGRSARRAARAARRAGRPARARSAAPRRPTAARPPSPTRVCDALGQRRDEHRGVRRRSAAAHARRRSRRDRPCRTLSRHGAADRARAAAAPRPRAARQASASPPRRSTPPHRTTPVGRVGEAQQEGEQRALARAARRPPAATALAGRRASGRRRRSAAAPRPGRRSPRPQAGSAAPARVGQRARRCRVGQQRRQVEHLVDPLGRRQAVGARVELAAQLAQRGVELGREQQHRQPGLEAHLAGDQPQPDRRRHERGAERSRAARGPAPTGRRRAGSPWSRAGSARRLGPRASDWTSARPWARRVGRPRTTSTKRPPERPQGAPARARGGLPGRHAHQHHEQRDQREGDRHDRAPRRGRAG